MRILGIDPGTTTIGYAIIDCDKELQVVNFGCFKTKTGSANSERVGIVFNFFKDLIKKYKPDTAAVESIYFFKNAKTAIKVSEIKGVILLALNQAGINIKEFAPLEVKRSVSNYGRAEKDQVAKMVKLILNLEKVPKLDDITDALAIAICCANMSQH